MATRAQNQAQNDDAQPPAAVDKHEDASHDASPDASPSRISDEVIPLADPDTFARPKPLLELGNPFLEQGQLSEGIRMPGGSVWQPSVLVYGTYRTAVQTFNDGDRTRAEWANRLDLFANVQLSATERVLFGLRPLDRGDRYTELNIIGKPLGFHDEINADPTTLFFEGDLGEILADVDPRDRHSLDWGFAVGRQELLAQNGMLINDTIDSIGLVRNNLLPSIASNSRLTFLYGWSQIDRADRQIRRGSDLFALLTQTDFAATTVEADFVYVRSDDDDATSGAFWGLGGTQRIGMVNTTFRVLGSQAIEDESPAVRSGHLFFGEVSWTPTGSEDLIYINGFAAIDQFTSAARGPDAGGPLGRAGILFAAVGIGRYGAPLGNDANDSVGAAIGYQLFFDHKRKQFVVEFGGRGGTDSGDDAMIALGGRYQQAIGQQAVLQLDLFGSLEESDDPGWGGRVELRFEF